MSFAHFGTNARRTSDGGIDPRFTFLRGHVAWELSEAGQERSDVLAVEHLLGLVRRHVPDANTHPLVRRWVNRRQFFYRGEADLRLYIPVQVRPAAGYLPHATDDEHYREQARLYMEQCTRLRREGQQPALRNENDLRSYAELPELLRAMHDRLDVPQCPDRRGVVLLARSGAGKTVACRKAFYDCVYATPDDESREKALESVAKGNRAASPEVALPDFVPCWVNLRGQSELLRGDWVMERLILHTLHPRASVAELDARVSLLQDWLRHGPPLLLFFDLNRAPADFHLPVARQLVGFQDTYGPWGHRCVVTYRSTRKDAPAMLELGSQQNATFGFYDLVPLKVEQATHYLRTLRETERCLFGDWLKELALPAQVCSDQQIDSDCGKLEELARMHASDGNATQEGLISTPLLMHFVASLSTERVAKIHSLADLYREVIDAHLERDKADYPDRWNRLGENAKTAIMTATVRIALAIQAKGRNVTRIDMDEARSLLASPLVESTTCDRAAYLPDDTYWSAGDYFTVEFSPEETRSLLELSLLRRDGDQTDQAASVGFLHDSLIYYLAGTVALLNRQRPEHNQCLDDRWRQAVVRRLYTAPELWELPAQFLSGALVGKTYEQSPVLEDLLKDLILACEIPPAVRLLLRFARGVSDSPVLQAVVRALQWHLGFLADYPMLTFAEVINYLTTSVDLPEGLKSFAHMLETGKRHSRPGFRYWLKQVYGPVPSPFLVMTEHSKKVGAIAVLPDGRVVSGSSDNTVKVWDPGTGEVRTMTEHNSFVTCLAVLPPGWVASGSNDKTVKLWNPTTGEVRTMNEHVSTVRALAARQDGWIASGSDDKTVKLWNPTTGEVRTMNEHRDSVRALAVLPDGRITSGSFDSTVRVWNPATGEVCEIPFLLGDPVTGKASWSEDARGGVFGLAVLPDGKVVYGGKTVNLWDPATDDVVIAPLQDVYRLVGLPNGRVVSGGFHKEVELWDPATGELWKGPHEPSGVTECIGVLPNGLFALGGIGRHPDIWDPVLGKVNSISEATKGTDARALAVLQDGRIAWGDDNGTVKVWDPACEEPPSSDGQRDLAIAVLTDGRIASGSTDKTVKLWNPRTGELRSMNEHTKPVWAVATLPDGRIVSGSADKTVKLWNPRTGEVRSMNEHTKPVLAVAALPDGRIVSGSDDTTVKLWNPTTGEVRSMNEHTEPVDTVQLLPDGQIGSRSDDTTKLWDPASGKVETSPAIWGQRGRDGYIEGYWHAVKWKGDVFPISSRIWPTESSGYLAFIRDRCVSWMDDDKQLHRVWVGTNCRVVVFERPPNTFSTPDRYTEHGNEHHFDFVAIGALPADPTGAVGWHPNGRQIAVGTVRGITVFELTVL